MRRFRQVDVFGAEPLGGNPVAVVLDGDRLTTGEMQRLASWTNLSETTFVSSPPEAGTDYRVRIFTPTLELPFAGHPTLGTCHAWLEAGGAPADETVVVQSCAAGPVRVRRDDEGLAFAAPPLVRSGPVEETELGEIAAQVGLGREEIVDAEWVDNGPGWVALLVESPERLLALRPGVLTYDVGVVAALPEASAEAFEVRAFVPAGGGAMEDPVTGSLNASLAAWLLRTGRVRTPYVARQGTALERSGRVRVSRDADGTIWVGGSTRTVIEGEIAV